MPSFDYRFELMTKTTAVRLQVNHKSQEPMLRRSRSFKLDPFHLSKLP